MEEHSLVSSRDTPPTKVVRASLAHFQRLARKYMQPENAVPIKPFFGGANDTALLDLIPFLKDIVLNDVSDVRNVLKKCHLKVGSQPDETHAHEKLSFQSVSVQKRHPQAIHLILLYTKTPKVSRLMAVKTGLCNSYCAANMSIIHSIVFAALTYTSLARRGGLCINLVRSAALPKRTKIGEPRT
jgi:hypothetical protein